MMAVDEARCRRFIREFNFRPLFVEELGWNNYSTRLVLSVENQTVTLTPIAEKAGMVAYLCPPIGGGLPAYPMRQKIEHAAAKLVYEHLIVYADAGKTMQVWQWVKREPGKPAVCRQHTYHASQSGEALVQKLRAIAFGLEEEERIRIVDAAGRVRAAFDVEKVTKKFYDRFKAEHTVFSQFVKGIQKETDRAWYVSLMLNRLMFVYFIQKKGFLDGDPDYLRHRLRVMQERRGKDRFLSFYRHFLLRLFHEGLGQQAHSAELDELLGKIPYLNGGLFDVHVLEQENPDIQIPDEAFEKVFAFFDAYQWHLDERPLRADNEINPDVLGYIFEKYINQKQMGAYYTKEDITEYIAKNTVIPFLFDAAREKCKIAFEGDQSVWRLLQADPDRYVYPAVRKGAALPLPPAIAAGLTDVAKRTGWNRPADEDYALPTEIWREVVARRKRYEDLRAKMANGEIRSIDDLITYNLDVRQFAQDVVESSEGPELLRAFYHAIERVTILDPTCGSGAFLFAALNILEPLYDACLEQMAAFVEDLGRSGRKHRPEKLDDFRKILARVEKHPNRRYFILKSIVVNNLYGVDIMDEAVEICKLRLFLKLVAQVERADDIEPLPDIDFNIRAGNTLVGFASYDEVKKAVLGELQGKLDLGGDMERLDESAEIADRAFQKFHAMQTEQGMDAEAFAEAKVKLRTHLDALDAELDRYLAKQYGVDPGSVTPKREYERRFGLWRDSHRPFHWFVEFYGIMKRGGFDVIIGNPPWKEYSVAKREYTVQNYTTMTCGNLHGICTERALRLRSPTGWMSFIVQLPLANSSRMGSVRALLRQQSRTLLVLPFDDRPGKLFDGLENCRSVIFVSQAHRTHSGVRLAVSRYQRWPADAREHLFARLEYQPVLEKPIYAGQFPKYCTPTEESVLRKVETKGKHIVKASLSIRTTELFVFYQEATRYWVKATVGLPYYAKNGVVAAPAHGRHLYFDQEEAASAVCALLNSSLFYAYFIAYGDCFHMSDGLVSGFPIPPGLPRDRVLIKLSGHLMEDLRLNAERKTIHTRDGDDISYDEYYAWKSKPVIDEIDRVLARHYGFTDEELDFIINYDIKYRMGREDGEGEG